MAERISAIVTTYQQERFVAETLRSVLDQTRPVDEIVVVDDGSSDRTLEIARSFRDPRLEVLQLPHRGIGQLSETYDHALARTSGTLVAVIEGDDRWRAEKLAVQERAFADPTVVVSHALYGVIGARGTLLRELIEPPVRLDEGSYDAFPLHLLMSYVMPVTALVRRSALEEIGGFRQLEGTPHTDHPTYLALAKLGRFYFHRRVVADWRKHVRSGTMRLVGVDLEGTRLSREMALSARAESSRTDLPSPTAIMREWDEAYARQLWHAARVLLVQRRHADARVVLSHARMLRGISNGIRMRLLLARVAARLRVDLEPLARFAGGPSPYSQLD